MSRIRADRVTNKEGTGAPLFPNGIRVVGLTSLSNVVAGVTTFTSDVSIGGTLTYEDVTNIDSVGLITARSGLKVTSGGIDVAGGGSNIVGVVTASTGIDAASNLILKTGGNEKVRISSTGLVGINETTPEEILDLGEDNKQNLKVGQRGYLGQAHSTSATILGHSVKADTTNSVADQMMVTETNSGGGAPSAIRQTTGTIQFHTASSGTADAVFSSERLRIGAAGQIGIAGANYGTSGQVLTSGGGSAAPSWTTPAAGAWALLQSASNPNTSTVDFVGLTTSYAAYKVQFIGANINSNNQRLMRCRVYLGGSLVTGSQDYRQQTMYMTYQSGSYNGSGTSRDCIALSGNNQISKGYNGELTFPMKLRTSGGAESLQAYYGTVVSQSYTNFVSGFMENSFSSLLTGIQFDSPDNYNVTDGQFYLYGLTRT